LFLHRTNLSQIPTPDDAVINSVLLIFILHLVFVTILGAIFVAYVAATVTVLVVVLLA